jgi:hypothetical protein
MLLLVVFLGGRLSPVYEIPRPPSDCQMRVDIETTRGWSKRQVFSTPDGIEGWCSRSGTTLSIWIEAGDHETAYFECPGAPKVRFKDGPSEHSGRWFDLKFEPIPDDREDYVSLLESEVVCSESYPGPQLEDPLH